MTGQLKKMRSALAEFMNIIKKLGVQTDYISLMDKVGCYP